MSAIKSKHEYKTILDFSDGRTTKNSIRQALKSTEFVQIHYHNNGIGLIYVDHEIRVGMYTIELLLDCTRDARLLKDYGRFSINVFEGNRKEINLNRDSRFKHQTWIDANSDNQLNMSHLTDVILHCDRLNKLKSFL